MIEFRSGFLIGIMGWIKDLVKKKRILEQIQRFGFNQNIKVDQRSGFHLEWRESEKFGLAHNCNLRI